MKKNVLELRVAGYAHLIKKLNLNVIPHWHTSAVSHTGKHELKIRMGGKIDEVYRLSYWPGETIGNHLEFALKYDGIHLGILKQVFKKSPQDVITEYIKSKPIGKYTRRIWFFYEFLMDLKLPIEDLSSGNYIEALDTVKYYTLAKGNKSKRHRVINNLLGPKEFCPIIRKTDPLSKMDTTKLKEQCAQIVQAYPPDLLRWALNYLYKKETKSSFEIEQIKPKASRTEQFIRVLKLAKKEDFCSKDNLISLQNKIVDPRFKENHYRKNQNYVGQTVSYQNEIIHFVAPKPKDLPKLMAGLLASHQILKEASIPPIVHAAVIAYGFVFLHPFEDGNGRIHRFLIHNILSLQGLAPQGLMFPISARMLKNPADYDASLEAFSQPLLDIIEFSLDELGSMEVETESAYMYQYMDMTTQVEALYQFVEQTIEEELPRELTFLANYDKTKKTIQNIIDMPDRLIDLFIQLCLQNNGHLSARKKESHFSFLLEKESKAMEQAIKILINR